MQYNLNGKWCVRDREREYNFEGNVPGTVQGDLVNLGKIPHPYKGLNEDTIIQLEGKDWIYEKEFDFQDSPKNGEEIDLVFKGIDTLANVYLNGIYLGNTQNMFMEYRFDVKDVLEEGRNYLKVEIKSPVRIPRRLERNYGKMDGSRESSRGYIRKAQYSYGWDWGARITTSGIWKPVYIEKYKIARLETCSGYLSDFDGTGGEVRVDGFVRSNTDLNDPRGLSVEVKINNEKIAQFPVEKVESKYKFNGTLYLDKINLWYPRGMGGQHLYNFSFILKDASGEKLYSEDKKIGLRTVKVIQEKDAEGKSFVFEVNGEKVFAKGANWVPADNILTWLEDQDYEKLIRMSYDANMNMLRIWGGGIYESDKFYTLCDEFGVMVWQDFMFACSEYPDHIDWFRELANREVRRVVRELRYHPSIVLWCGNNENNWGFDEWGSMTRKVDGYNLGNRLYLLDFPKICAKEDPSRDYWVSSPYGGDTANSPREGDRHVWTVWNRWADYDEYLKDNGRFISEFGFQGAPHWKTIQFFADNKEKEVFHPVMVRHNKQVEGQERAMRFINGRFGLVKDFRKFLYLSQLNQAEAVKTGVEHWRSRKIALTGDDFKTLYPT